MYTFFANLGYKKRKCEWLPLLIIRLCLGVFFILSGFFKTFDAQQHQKLLHTLTEAHIPYPVFQAYCIPLIQMVCGGLILLGLLTSLASLLLFLVTVLSLITDRLALVLMHDGIQAVEHSLYFPEFLYALMFFWLFFSGPGNISVDLAYGKKRCLSRL